MATSTPVIVPLAEYLDTVYRPDRDWIDGETNEDWALGFTTRPRPVES